ncbi:MAG TPA: ferritin-like domain-containing protein [Jatrophihabitans sp.]|nr:ferritin-like domain-containing protein [Jatrophihabitans sp.]
MTSPAADPITAALQQALAREHAAVYGYPVIGVQLAGSAQADQARAAEAAHRLVRDALAEQLAGRHADPVAAQPSYRPPAPLTDDPSAQDWAIQLEQDCAAGYRALLASAATASGASTSLRQQALTGLSTAARQAGYWRSLRTPDTPTVPFPGL